MKKQTLLPCMILALLQVAQAQAMGRGRAQITLEKPDLPPRKIILLESQPQIDVINPASLANERTVPALPSFCGDRVSSCFMETFDINATSGSVKDALSGPFASRAEAENWITLMKAAIRLRGREIQRSDASYLQISKDPSIYVSAEPIDLSGVTGSSELASAHPIVWTRANIELWRVLGSDAKNSKTMIQEMAKFSSLSLKDAGLTDKSEAYDKRLSESSFDLRVDLDRDREARGSSAGIEVALRGKGASGAGNGGGGAGNPTDGWVGVNWPVTVTTNYSAILDIGPVIFEQCSGYPGLITVSLPQKYSHLFAFIDKKNRPLTTNQICSDLKLFWIYQDFINNLAPQLADSQSVMSAVIDRLLALGSSPVIIRLTDRPEKLPAIGGKILETSWFDSKTGVLSWSPMSSKGGLLGMMLRRQPQSLLLHEMMHVLTFRAFGGYPVLSEFHDARDNKSLADYLKIHTSPEAAYLESISNMVELGTSFSHPMVRYSPIEAPTPFRCGDKSCYYDYESFNELAREFSLDERLSNEAFMTTALEKFVVRNIDDHGALHYNSVDEIKKTLIDAVLTNPEHLNFLTLMKRYDEIAKTNEGWRFLRDFFNYDYRKGGRLVPSFRELTEWRNELGVEAGNAKYLEITGPITPDNLFIPYVGKLRDQALKQSQVTRTEQYTQHGMSLALEILSSVLARELGQVGAEEPTLLSREEAVGLKLEPYFGKDALAKIGNEPKAVRDMRLTIVETVADRCGTKNQPLEIDEVFDSAERFVATNHEPQKTYASQLGESIANLADLEKLIQADDSPDSPPSVEQMLEEEEIVAESPKTFEKYQHLVCTLAALEAMRF